MRLKQKGKFWELPICGYKIERVVFEGRPTLIFNDEKESFLDIHSKFKVTQFNQAKEIEPSGKEALLLFYELLGVIIKDAKADNGGNLFLLFEDNTEIIVEDGPYENWHFTTISKGGNLYVHGGVGKTIW